MQQVPVHKDNRELREALRDKISSFGIFSNSYLLKEIEDYLLPSLVYYYYLNKNNDFIKYLKDLDFEGNNYKFILKLLKNYTESNRVRPLGDLHPGDSTKVLIGNNVVYGKYPDYGDLLFALASYVYSDYKNFFPKICKKGNLFERDFIEVNKQTKSKKDLRGFYFNLGRIIPFLLFVRAIDLNAENGLVNLPYPVFFDMETIFSGEFSQGFDDYGIRNSGLVQVDEKNDSSFLTGGLKERESLLKPLICGDSSNPYIGWRTKSKGSYENQPQFNDRFVNPSDYLIYMKKGYFDIFEKILEKKEDLEKILEEHNAYIRVVIRPTRMYRFLILKSCYPQVYLKNKRKEFVKNSLEDYNLIYRFKDEKLVNKEVDALLNLKVPVFYSSLKQKEIFCSNGDTIGFWYRNPYRIWKEYSVKLDKAFFEKQWEVIAVSF